MTRPEWDSLRGPSIAAGDRFGLSPFQVRILNAISHGLDEPGAATVLGVPRYVVHDEMASVRHALAAKNQAHAIARAFRFGILA